MMMIKTTYHSSVERIDRLCACIEHLGLSDDFVIEARDRRYPGTIRKMTSTGIILVFSEETNSLITGYMATPAQMYQMYSERKITNIPPKIYKRVHKNYKKFSFLLEI